MTLLQTNKKKSYLTPTGIYEIPEDWIVERLGNLISDMQSGFASGERDSNGIVQLRMNNINSDGGLEFEQLLKVPVPPDIGKYDLKQNDVIFNNTNSLELIGKATIVHEKLDYTFSNHLTRIRVKKEQILPYFLYLILLRYRGRSLFKSICNTHVGQSGIGRNELLSLEVFFPSMSQQHKIASIISKAEELISKTDKFIDQTQRFNKALTKRLLTKGLGHTEFKRVQMGLRYMIEEYPVLWEISRMDDICKIERGKFAHRPRDDPDYYGGKYPFIQTGDVEKSNGHIQSFSQTLNQKGLSVSKLFPKDIVVITIAANIGTTAITTFPVCFPDSIVGISSSKMNLKFIEYYLRTRKKFLEIIATVSAQPNINLETLKPLLIPIPPREEQDKIAGILYSVDSWIQEQQNYKHYLKSLKKGLMQKLLTGKIRVKP